MARGLRRGLEQEPCPPEACPAAWLDTKDEHKIGRAPAWCDHWETVDAAALEAVDRLVFASLKDEALRTSALRCAGKFGRIDALDRFLALRTTPERAASICDQAPYTDEELNQICFTRVYVWEVCRTRDHDACDRWLVDGRVPYASDKR